MIDKTIYSTKANEVIELMLSMQDEKKAVTYQRFFKTGKGEYGEGDSFLGIVNPKVHAIVKQVGIMSLDEIHILLISEWHEIRLCGLLILVKKFEKLCKKKLIESEEATFSSLNAGESTSVNEASECEAIHQRDEIVNFYIEHAERANNWDLVDLSVSKILGTWLLLPTYLGINDTIPSLNVAYKQQILDELAVSSSLWKQRMSIVCTWKTIREGDTSWCLRYATKHLHHKHDLMHKAVGWMLREMGKSNMDLLREFLDEHIHEMPRTMLRYAIEKMSEDERQMWLRR